MTLRAGWQGRVALTGAALLYGVALGHGHTPYIVALMLAAIWRRS